MQVAPQRSRCGMDQYGWSFLFIFLTNLEIIFIKPVQNIIYQEIHKIQLELDILLAKQFPLLLYKLALVMHGPHDWPPGEQNELSILDYSEEGNGYHTK